MTPWDQSRSTKADNAAFIFSLDLQGIYPVNEGAVATHNYPEYGPSFWHDLIICSNSNKEMQSGSVMTSYPLPLDKKGKPLILRGKNKFLCSEIEVF